MTKMLCAALAVAGTACMLAGCATTPIAASTDSLRMHEGQELTVVTHDPHVGFLQSTAGAAAFGVIGAIASASSSSDLVKENDIVNPALRVSARLRFTLLTKLKPSTVNSVSDMNGAKLAVKNGLVFDVNGYTISNYFPTDWTHYRITYNGTARLIDAVTGKTVAQAPCTYDSGAENAPTYEQLYANGAYLLKSKLLDAVDVCADQIASTMF